MVKILLLKMFNKLLKSKDDNKLKLKYWKNNSIIRPQTKKTKKKHPKKNQWNFQKNGKNYIT